MHRRSIEGFTLIELSIVLVIIGLLVGGVLVGRDLIHAAQLRSVATDYEKLVTATHTFQAKYNCLPGDCARATRFFPDAVNGNGDRHINSAFWYGSPPAVDSCPAGGSGGGGPGALTTESFQYFSQLAEAQLIPGSYTGEAGAGGWRNYLPGVNVMATKFNPTIGYSVVMYAATEPDCGSIDFTPGILTNYYGNIIYIGAMQPDDGGVHGNCCETYSAAFTPADGYYIDRKIDDGLPASGKMAVWAPLFQQSASGANCTTTLDSTTARYDLSSNALSCGFMVRAGF